MAPNPYFQFRQFRIVQDHCAMKVGTDGVLLGAWAPCSSAHRVLDVGTGTGLLALMVAQRNPLALIDAVEIDADSARQAAQNVSASPWHDRIRIHCQEFQAFASQSHGKYGLIISNPPYFRDALRSPDTRRTSARHDDCLSLEELVRGVTMLLDEDGLFSVVMPVCEGALLTDLCLLGGLFLRRRTWVFPMRRSAQPKRVLMTFSSARGECGEDQLVIEEDHRHEYSEDYRRLTEAFYL